MVFRLWLTQTRHIRRLGLARSRRVQEFEGHFQGLSKRLNLTYHSAIFAITLSIADFRPARIEVS